MRVIAKPALINFWHRFPDSEEPLKAWHSVMRLRDYQNPNQLKAEFGTASLLGDGYVVFNIAGNKYRLLVHIRYDISIVFIKRVLTHQEYDELNAAGTLIEKKARDGD
jgi:mRNA interferase HigB